MELKLANIISNLLVFGFEFFVADIEDLFSRVHFLHHEFPNILSTKWNVFWGKMQKSNNSSEAVHQCSRVKSGGERKMRFAEINLMLNGVGIVGLDDCENKINLDEDDLLALFDEEEPSFEEMKETFKVFDVNNDGFIDGAELQRVVCSLGLKEGCSLDECKRMINHFDGNGDGLIDFQEFLKFMDNCLR